MRHQIAEGDGPRIRVTSKDVAEQIRRAMGARKVSNAELARRIQMSPMATYRRTSGKCSTTVEELIAIAEAMDVPVEDLIPSPRQRTG
jgi:transcriptional regulator with XRE-family HTH domain